MRGVSAFLMRDALDLASTTLQIVLFAPELHGRPALWPQPC